MRNLKQNEALGLFAALVLVGLVFFGRYAHPLTGGTDAEEGSADIVRLENSSSQSASAFSALSGAINTSSGDVTKLIIEDIVVGNGAEIKKGDTISVHYVGSLQDGTQFDNSYNRGTPLEFKVGSGKVIEGWDLGVVGMKIGGKRIVVIPPDMAYGNRKVGPIPPNATLIFAIEALESK